jgi:hypothetical protein
MELWERLGATEEDDVINIEENEDTIIILEETGLPGDLLQPELFECSREFL